MAEIEHVHEVSVHEDQSEGTDQEVRWWWECSCGTKDETRLERAHAEAAASTHGSL